MVRMNVVEVELCVPPRFVYPGGLSSYARSPVRRRKCSVLLGLIDFHSLIPKQSRRRFPPPALPCCERSKACPSDCL
ncbi:hypothetical protein AOLI_G00130260 [Acnodon oligacanthus]